MRGLVTGGAGNMEEFPGRLKYLELPFEICVKDLRSQVKISSLALILFLSLVVQVIRESCITIAYLAQELQYKVHMIFILSFILLFLFVKIQTFLLHLLPFLIDLIQHGAKVRHFPP